MSIVGRAEDRLPEWQRAWNGVLWHQMPGDDSDHQKLNFALWKRGLKEYELDEETGAVRELCPAFGRIVSLEPRDAERRRAYAQRQDAKAVEKQSRQERVTLLVRRVKALKERGVSASQLAVAAGLNPRSVSKLKCGEKMLSSAKLDVLERVIVEAELCPPPPLRPEAPEGCVPFKDWLITEAERLGLTGPALYERIRAGKHPRPVMVKLNQRRHFVRVMEGPAVGEASSENTLKREQQTQKGHDA